MFGKVKTGTRPVYQMKPGADLLYYNTPLDYNLRVFGVPGASLRHANISDDNGQISAGIKGEQRVADELSRLAAQYPNMYVFHSVKLPGKVGDMDHIVMQGDRILLVDSKNWKGHATYKQISHNYASNHDTIIRNGERFEGGRISLPGQTRDWRIHFASSGVKVESVLLIANHTSTINPSGSNPLYHFSNLTTLEQVFATVFTTEAVAPLSNDMLRHMTDLVQNPDFDPENKDNFVLMGYENVNNPYVHLSGVPGATKSWVLVGWSILNYVAALLLFPVIVLSVIPLIVVAHRHIPALKMRKLPTLKVKLVLTFQYMLLSAWFFTIFLSLFYFIGRM